MPSLILYAAPMSSATPVVSAMAELDVPCETVMLDLAAGDQKRPEYLKLNPNGWVPTLVVDGAPMFEAVAIMQWLAKIKDWLRRYYARESYRKAWGDAPLPV